MSTIFHSSLKGAVIIFNLYTLFDAGDLFSSVRTILPLLERNSWHSSRQLEASVTKAAPADPKDEKLKVYLLLL